MSNRLEQKEKLEEAVKALETQRAILGDEAVDLALKGLHQQLTELKAKLSTAPQIEGERRQATILFSDLSGYTAMSEKLDPEEVELIMNRIKEAAVQIIENHEGTVNQFVGDEVVALFGIPQAHEDDPARAVKAALELHTMVRAMSEEVESLIGEPLTMHSGINTGLIVTAMRDARDGKFGLTGDTVNTGARILDQSEADEILVSPETQRRIAPYFKTELREPTAMKGKESPVVSYRILSKTAIQTRIEAAEQRGFTQYTGRDEELATLNACLEKTIQGAGQFVTVKGDAGLGKSRLLYEFRYNLDRTKIMVLQGRCQPYGVSTPYFPLLDAMRRVFNLGNEDSPAELHQKVMDALLMLDPVLEQYIPVYLHILSIPSDSYPLAKELSGEKLKQAIQEALVTIITLTTQYQPIVLILEDWHWTDKDSDATLMKFLENMASCPLMIVVLYRPEYVAQWGEIPFHTPIDLALFNEKSAESMVKAIYQVEHLPEKFSSQIFQHSGGNPFFIEELCDLLKEEGRVLIDRNAHQGEIRLNQPIEQIKFPETVQAVVRTRLDRLDPDSKEVMRLASVIGREFLKRILEQLTTRPEIGGRLNLTPSLESLKASDLIRPIDHLPELTFQFNHHITHGVTYQTLLLKQRILLHRLVAETIEVLYTDRLERQFEVLAYHYSKSEERGKALYYLELAGDKAARNFSLLDARTHYKDAINLIDEHRLTMRREATTHKQKRIKISLKWAQISHFASPEETVLILETSLEYAKELDDGPQMAHLNYWLGQRYNMIGNFKQAMEYLSHCAELAEQWNEKALLAQAQAANGLVYFFEAKYTKAIELLEKSIPVFEELDEPDGVARSASVLCGSYCMTTNFEKALNYGKQAIKITKKIGNLSREANSHMWLGAAYLLQGNWEKCIESESQAIKIARPLGDVVPTINGSVWLGYGLFMNGSQQEGLLTIQEGIKMMEASKIYQVFPLHYSLSAYCYAKLGRMEEAQEAADKCLEWVPKSLKGWEFYAYCALALVEAQKEQANFQSVDQIMKKALHLCQEREQRPLFALGYFHYSQLLLDYPQGTEDRQKAEDYLNQATELFIKMKMTWWLEQGKELKVRLGVAVS